GATGGAGMGDAGRQEGGEYAETQPMGQTELVEANSEEGREAVAQQERQPQQQPSRQPSQQRQPQQPRQQQPRQQPAAPDEEAEPMGALAQALTAHLRSGDTEEEEAAPTSTAGSAPAPVAPAMEEATSEASTVTEAEAEPGAADAQ